ENRIDDPSFQAVVQQHRKCLPTVDVPAAPGSRARRLETGSGKVIWEGKEVRPGDPIPEIEEE
ncbi:MAG: choline-sulfatase, partial [Planctomycetota bacterium]|nr:choline-sulfatase [Planctomycetota bacterium]